MRRKRMRLVSLILSAVCLLGCAVQPAPVSDSSESNTKVSAYAASQAEQNEEERTEAERLVEPIASVFFAAEPVPRAEVRSC